MQTQTRARLMLFDKSPLPSGIMARVESQFGLIQPRQKAEDIVRLDAVNGVRPS